MQKLLKRCVVIMMLLFMAGLLGSSTSYCASKYKKVNYKDFKVALKAECKKNMMMKNEVDYAYAKIKTPFGLKKVLLVRHTGTTEDCATVAIFVKKGNKLYRGEETGFVVCQISKNGKYVLIPGPSTAIILLKYSKGEYRNYKTTDPSAASLDLPKMGEKTMIKRYKLTQDVRWTNYKYKKPKHKKKQAFTKKVPKKICGQYLSGKNLNVKYKKNYLYLTGWYRAGWKGKEKKINAKIKVASGCKVRFRAENKIVRVESLKSYAKENTDASGYLKYIGFEITVKHNKVVDIILGD